VTNPKNVGRFKYKQRKLDYQMEEELSGNLRQMKPIGNDLLLQDRFDSIFRRNLVEPDAPTQGQKKRQRKAAFKMHNRLGTKAEEIRN
jgi:nucleolar protein 53